MKSITAIADQLENIVSGATDVHDARELLNLGEEILTCWVTAKGHTPTTDEHEGFRLLALQRQGAKGDPSFNACRETCRELVYYYNLFKHDRSNGDDAQKTLKMMALVANHLCLFVNGKMEVAELGNFCCSAAPIRNDANELAEIDNA